MTLTTIESDLPRSEPVVIATEMKYAPLKDLCALGGWKSPQTA
jgi:hypothetical protein